MPESQPPQFIIRSDPHTYEVVREAVLASAGKGAKLLDVGCGTGAFLHSIRDIAPDAEGCDFNTEQYQDTESLSRIRKADLNAEPLPYADDSFDVVTSLDVLEHVFHPYRLVEEALRVVRPGGYVILSTPNVASILQKAQYLFTGRFKGFFDPAQSAETGERHISPIFRETLEQVLRGKASIVKDDFNRTVIPKLRVEVSFKHPLVSEGAIWTIRKDG